MAKPTPFSPTGEQTRIAHERAHRVLIEANAGAGKTTVLCMRALRRVAEGVDASRIVMLAYSDPGSKAIRRTLEKLRASAAMCKGIRVGTFDDFCSARLARLENDDVARLDRPEQVRPYVLEAIVHARSNSESRFPGEFALGGGGELAVEALLEEFERFKGTMAPQRLLQSARVTPSSAADAGCDYTSLAIFQAYERLRRTGAGSDGVQVRFRYGGDPTYDLACMLVADDPVFTCDDHPLRTTPLEALFVDEFHDMNWAMATVLRGLMTMHPNAEFAGVGDVDQVIHAASGAQSYFLRSGFEIEFGPVTRLPLTETQRFGEAIARRLGVFAQKPYAWNASRESRMEALALTGAKQQARHIESVLHLRRQAAAESENSQVAVLLRHPHAALDLEFHLLDRGIGYETEGFTAYMSRPEVLFVRMILAAAVGYDDAFTATSFRDAKRAAWDFIGGHLTSDGLVDPRTDEKVDAATFDTFRSVVLPEFLERTDRQPAARRVRAAMTMASADRIDQLASVLETLNMRDVARRVFVNAEAATNTHASMRAIARMASMNDFGSVVELLRVIRMQEEQLQGWSSTQRIVLSTIDRAKGLEFDHVIIPGLDQGEFEGNDEDERNLFYVAVSRARQTVQLLHSPQKAGGYVPAHLVTAA